MMDFIRHVTGKACTSALDVPSLVSISSSLLHSFLTSKHAVYFQHIHFHSNSHIAWSHLVPVLRRSACQGMVCTVGQAGFRKKPSSQVRQAPSSQPTAPFTYSVFADVLCWCRRSWRFGACGVLYRNDGLLHVLRIRSLRCAP